MAIRRRSSAPRRSRIVNASSSACVGCSAAPSPGVHDGRVGKFARERGGRSRLRAADHEDVGGERGQGPRRVEEGLALLERGGLGGKAQGLRRQPPGGELEGGLRSRGRLEKQQGHGAAHEDRGPAARAARPRPETAGPRRGCRAPPPARGRGCRGGASSSRGRRRHGEDTHPSRPPPRRGPAPSPRDGPRPAGR